MTSLWEDLGTLSNVAMALAAIGALVYAHLQIGEGRRMEREADANELWRETLRLGFDNPKLSDPTLNLADFNYVDLTVDGSKETFQKYELFVDNILNASEKVLDVCPTNEWITSVRIQLKQHHSYLLSEHFKRSGYIEQYTPKFRAFVEKALIDVSKDDG